MDWVGNPSYASMSRFGAGAGYHGPAYGAPRFGPSDFNAMPSTARSGMPWLGASLDVPSYFLMRPQPDRYADAASYIPGVMSAGVPSYAPQITVPSNPSGGHWPHASHNPQSYYEQSTNQNTQASTSPPPPPPPTTDFQPSRMDSTAPASNVASISRPGTPDSIYYDAPQTPDPAESSFPVSAASENQSASSPFASSDATAQTPVSVSQASFDPIPSASAGTDLSVSSGLNAASALTPESVVAPSILTADSNPVTVPSASNIPLSPPEPITGFSSSISPTNEAPPSIEFADLPPMEVPDAIPAPLFSAPAAPPQEVSAPAVTDTMTARTPDASVGSPIAPASASSLTCPLKSPYAQETANINPSVPEIAAPSALNVGANPQEDGMRSFFDADTPPGFGARLRAGTSRAWSGVKETVRPHGLDLDKVGDSVAAGTSRVGDGMKSLYKKGMNRAWNFGHSIANTTNAAAGATKSRLKSFQTGAGRWLSGSVGESRPSQVADTDFTAADRSATSAADPLPPATSDLGAEGLAATATAGLGAAANGAEATNTANSYWSNVTGLFPKRFPKIKVPWGGKSTQAGASVEISASMPNDSAGPATTGIDLPKTAASRGWFSYLPIVSNVNWLKRNPATVDPSNLAKTASVAAQSSMPTNVKASIAVLTLLTGLGMGLKLYGDKDANDVEEGKRRMSRLG